MKTKHKKGANLPVYPKTCPSWDDGSIDHELALRVARNEIRIRVHSELGLTGHRSDMTQSMALLCLDRYTDAGANTIDLILSRADQRIRMDIDLEEGPDVSVEFVCGRALAVCAVEQAAVTAKDHLACTFHAVEKASRACRTNALSTDQDGGWVRACTDENRMAGEPWRDMRLGHRFKGFDDAPAMSTVATRCAAPDGSMTRDIRFVKHEHDAYATVECYVDDSVTGETLACLLGPVPVMPSCKHQMASPAAVTGVLHLMIRIQDDIAYAQEFPISKTPSDIAQLAASLAVWLGYEDTI